MTLRVGFIGAGGIARMHMKTLNGMDDVEMVAFCDVIEERAKACADQYGGRIYTDHHEMFDKEELDAVYVCIPPFAHNDQEVLAAQAGIHLFVEKPVALDLDVATRASDAISNSGIINSVGYHFRYFDTTDAAKEQLQSHTIGMVLGYWMGGMPGTSWWRRMDGSGGQVVEQTTHIFDLARYIVGEITGVCAGMALRALHTVPDFNVSDVGSVLIWFENGAIGCISNTCMLKRGYKVGLEVICPELIIELRAGAARFIHPDGIEELQAERNGHVYETELFIQAIKQREQSLIRCDYADAVKTLAVTLAANESAQKGTVVKVPTL